VDGGALKRRKGKEVKLRYKEIILRLKGSRIGMYKRGAKAEGFKAPLLCIQKPLIGFPIRGDLRTKSIIYTHPEADGNARPSEKGLICREKTARTVSIKGRERPNY